MGRIRLVIGWSAYAALSACSGCAAAREGGPAQAEISHILERQADAWNTGNIAEFMDPYWHSPDLTFSSGGNTTRGWQATFDRYVQKYPTREAMGELTFSELEVREVSPGAALVLGRWQLERAEPVGGNFTLVMRRVRGEWVIVHDHTSTLTR